MTTETASFDLQTYLAARLNLAIYFFGYAIPFLVAQPQLLTGTIVNALLFVSSEKLGKKSLYPILILPSLGAISHGVLFGPRTFFLAYFLPFIWLGNYLQTSVFSLAGRWNYLARVLVSASAKCLLLFAAANIYYQARIVPQIFVTSMGAVQFITACLGGLLAYFILQSLKKYD